MQRHVIPSSLEDGGAINVPFELYHTPKRERRAEHVTIDAAAPERHGGSTVIQMVAVTVLLAAFVLLPGFSRERFGKGRVASLQPRFDKTEVAINQTGFEKLLNKTLVGSELSDHVISTINTTFQADLRHKLSKMAWQSMLERYRMAMQTQSFITWLPTIIRDGKLLVAQQHLSTVQRSRFGIFTTIIHDALNITSSGNHFGLPPLLEERLLGENRSIPLLMALGDHRRCHYMNFPRFTWCTLKDENCTAFALPSYSLYQNAPVTSPSYDEFHKNLELQYPWLSKLAKAVWRGSATGRITNDWTDLPRARLVNVSINHPHLLDAGFVKSGQFARMYPQHQADLHNFSQFGNWIKFHDFQKYRAIVDIDGNSWSDRFGRLLCLNSAVIKVQPANENYFFHELKPWVHYIPVAANLSDILQALDFAVSNQTAKKVRLIAFRANEWCRKRLTRSSMARDVIRTLTSYLQYLGDDESRWREWDELFDEYQTNMTLVEVPLK